VECDPSIKAIILKIDKEHGHSIIMEDIDDEHLLIKSNREEDLKQLLKDVSGGEGVVKSILEY
jgi:TFIIH basal transcription factor complex TTD-A subunit